MGAGLSLLITLALLIYVLFPLTVWFQLRLRDEQKYENVEEEDLSPQAAEFFGPITAEMTGIGFEHVAYLRAISPQINLVHFHTLWLNRSTGQAAMHSVLMSIALPQVKVRSLEFQTELEDGTTIETNNQVNLRTFVYPATEHMMQFPQIEDVTTLYKLHLWHERQWASPSTVRYLSPQGRELEDVQKSSRRTMQLQVAAGRFKEITGGYAPTLPGAFLMAWKQAPPFKQIRLARARLRGRHLLTKAQKEDIAPPVGVQITDRYPHDPPPTTRDIDRRWS